MRGRLASTYGVSVPLLQFGVHPLKQVRGLIEQVRLGWPGHGSQAGDELGHVRCHGDCGIAAQ